MNFDTTALLARIDKLANDAIAILPGVVGGIIVFLISWLVARSLRRTAVRATERHGRARNAGLAAGRVAQGAAILVGLLIALSMAVPTFRPSDVISFLGIGGVAVGFAFRDILQNFLAGILLLLTEPFQIGDQIVVGGYEGVVEDIQTRATFIRTYDGRRAVIPNADLFTQKVLVNTAYPRRRIEYELNVPEGWDVELVRGKILDELDAIDEIERTPPPDILMVDLPGNSAKLRVRWWVKPPEHDDEVVSRDKVLAAIRRVMMTNRPPVA